MNIHCCICRFLFSHSNTLLTIILKSRLPMKVQLILVCLLVEYASTTLESLMQIISINSKKYDMYGWEYVDLYEDDAQHIPLVEETPKFIQRMIKNNNNNNWNKPILKNNEFLSHLNASNLPWTYNNYLTTSIRYILLRWHEIIDECYSYVKDEHLKPLCSIQFGQKAYCSNGSIKKFSQSLVGKVKLFPLTSDASINNMAIESILLSNCAYHIRAIQKANDSVKHFPNSSAFRFLYAEVLSRNSHPESLTEALKEITVAVNMDSSVILYRVKKLSLLLRLGYMEKAREEGEQLTKILAENPSKSCYLQQNNCLHKPIHHSESMAIWRPWFYLGLFHLVDSNLSAASEDFTIAFNLASLTLSTDKPLSKSTIGLLMYMKALSALYKSEILDAMELAIKGVHNYPFILDTILLLAQSTTRASFSKNSLNILDLAFPLLDSAVNDPSSPAFVETYTELKLVKHQIIQLRALVNYRQGNILQAKNDATLCLDLFPLDGLCVYIKTLCELCTGSLMSAIKSSAVLSYNLNYSLENSSEIFHLKYLIEWIRYVHSHLYHSLNDFHWLDNFPERLIHSWIRGIPMGETKFFTTQSGIISYTPNPVVSPDYMKTILNEKSSQSITESSEKFNECNQKSFLLTSQPVHCQKFYLNRLKNYLCHIDGQMGVPSDSANSQSDNAAPDYSLIINQRQQLALAVSSLYSAELIRNFWCYRHRVSFSTCWAYSQDRQAQASANNHRRKSFNNNYPPPSQKFINDCSQLSLSSSPSPPSSINNNTYRPFWLKRLCKLLKQQAIEKPYPPDWFVQTSITARLLHLADPYEELVFWKVYTPNTTDNISKNYVQNDENNSPDSYYDNNEENENEEDYDADSNGRADVNSDRQNKGDKQRKNQWENGLVWDETFFIKSGHILHGHVAYMPHVIIELMLLLEEKIGHLPDHLKFDRNNFEIHCIDQSHDYGHLHVNKLNRVLDQSKQDCLIPTLNKLWRYAQIAELFDENFNVFINLYVPGTMYLNTDYTLRSPSSSWDSKPIKRHLAVVLKFTKHPEDNTYSLSMLRLSNPMHRDKLIAEMDSAFDNYLLYGEKALSDILASPNIKGDFVDSSSFTENKHLQNALQSIFDWLYYWSILKPIASYHSFRIGYSMALGMLRAIGLQPTVFLPKSKIDLEMESIFIGSSEKFGELCRNVLGLSGLSKSSLSLSWEISPEEVIKSPKHFLEFLNLQLVSNCAK